MADRLGISKADMLDAEEGGEAVRVALAETTVIEETRKWFENVRISIETGNELCADLRYFHSMVLSLMKPVGKQSALKRLFLSRIFHMELRRLYYEHYSPHMAMLIEF